MEKAEIKPASEAERLAAKEARKLWGNQANDRRPIFKDLWYIRIGRLPDGVDRGNRGSLGRYDPWPDNDFLGWLTRVQESLARKDRWFM